MNFRPNLGIIGFGEQNTCFGVYKTLVSQIGENLQEDFDVNIYGCKKEGIEEDTNSSVKKYYTPGQLNKFQTIRHKLKTISRILSSSDILLALGSKNSFILPFFRFYRRKKVVLYLSKIAAEKQSRNPLKKFWAQRSEKLAIKYADQIISENKFIDDYIRNTYARVTETIHFGGDHDTQENSSAVFSFTDKEYVLGLTSDMDIEQTEMLLKACSEVHKFHLVLLGKWDVNQEMESLYQRYGGFENIHLMSYNSMKASFTSIKKGAFAYIHHHVENSTHPLLLEMMNMGIPTILLDTPINREVTKGRALYYTQKDEIRVHLDETSKSKFKRISKAMRGIIRRNYSWQKAAELLRDHLLGVYEDAHQEPKKKEEKEVLLLKEAEMV